MLNMAKIAVIGSGFVGQATGKGFALRGHEVVFCDVNRDVVKTLEEQGYDACAPNALTDGRDCDIFFISVPTPTIKGKTDLSYVRSAVTALAQGSLRENKKYCLVVLRSTVVPGTTENLAIPILEEHSGKTAGKDFGVCFNPEYLREASSQEDFDDPCLIMIGKLDKRSGETLKRLYAPHFSCPIHLESFLFAELHKLAHNALNAMTISMGNELGLLCEAVGIDPMDLLPLIAQSAEGRRNPAYGFRRTGHYGGSCLPKDTVALKDWSESRGFQMPLLEAAIRVNMTMIENNGGFESLPKKEMVY
jgi:UDPglucose 6-dehydrogenase